ncbi:bifunctional 2-C-methyl-D-erythritol 4-phosphate cytidylyltransferase/2-C-methyl-D-erythritol 2,4-cyclodiphosphate synthase [Gulosibacter bifidus]|uniref:Multifunctional fusion protein n=1 Tax=Gulosibacter bifidus TaxID=272239 RepID=A0ABW5RIH1_9MICO|nr:bifunctional 2-C-methyl-D-erythritol 4-phosphate cytidylyltransferase/2-C-methyl-D-erythritol 2,4-cyclodiphosphate synthase [Gulosibacter bifidus]
MTCTGVVIGAAGNGTRLGLGTPKAFVPLGGSAMLVHALRGLSAIAGDVAVVVAVPPEDAEAQRQARASLAAVAGQFGQRLIHASTVPGGDTRFASVRAAVDALPDRCDVVLVHDAARALTPPEVFARVADAVRESNCGIVPVLPVVDTLKRVNGHDNVTETPVRSELRAAQTPQGFPAQALRDAYARGTDAATDDAATFAQAGGQVRTVPGDALAFKITTPDDLARAERILADRANVTTADAATEPEQPGGVARDGHPVAATSQLPWPMPEMRVGVGTDIHAFDANSECWLAGLHFPDAPGLSGHSDGDAAAHAVVDALLSAAGLGDIGALFGTEDPRFAGAHGRVFLTATRELLESEGWQIQNAAVQVVCRRPRFGDRASEASALLSEILGAPVSVAATTSDGLGFMADTSNGGVFAFATACLIRQPRP